MPLSEAKIQSTGQGGPEINRDLEVLFGRLNDVVRTLNTVEETVKSLTGGSNGSPGNTGDTGGSTGGGGSPPTSDTNVSTAVLASDASTGSTTGSEITGLSLTLEAGTYVFEYHLFIRSNNTSYAPYFGVNYTGTAPSVFFATLAFPGASTTDGDATINTGTPRVYGHSSVSSLATTTPNIQLLGFNAADTDYLVKIFGAFKSAGAGDLELWMASENALGTVQTTAGSVAYARKMG